MSKCKVCALIPARLESTRLPNKLLLDLKGKSLIRRVFENIKSFNIFNEIYVATDSQRIKEVCESFACSVIMTDKDHESGTSRIAEASKKISAEIIVNIQGDEPFLQKDQIQQLILNLEKDKNADIATLVFPTQDKFISANPNIVKAVADKFGYALYFSRFPIPYLRDESINGKWLLHLGVYAYKKNFINNYFNLTISEMEKKEKLEQLTFLYNGYKILLVETNQKTIGIDTLEDLEEAKKLINN